jgi:excisionase family DNA binding protein
MVGKAMSIHTEPPALVGLPMKLLTMQEVADYLDVPLSWVQDQVRTRKVRCSRIGKHVRFTHDQVVEIVAAGEQRVVSRSASRSKL